MLVAGIATALVAAVAAISAAAGVAATSRRRRLVPIPVRVRRGSRVTR